MSLISLQAVSKRFGDVQAVDDLSLEVPEGRFFSIVGPSGSGKTTVLRLVAGFLRPSSGSILIGNQDVSGLAPEKRDIGLVFQNYALFPHLSVFENIAFGLRVRKVADGEIRERVMTVLEQTGLGGYDSRQPHELSGGEQQRVAVARALVIRPRVLLLDEPLGALDRLLREQMQYWIKALQNELQVTTVYVTHDQIEALTMSDHIAVMHRGVLQQVDTPERLYRRPANRFVAEFMGDNNLLAGVVLSEASGQVEVEVAGGQRLSAAAPAGATAGEQVEVSIRPEDVELHPLQGAASPPRAPAPDTLTGTVRQRIYRGAVSRYEVVVDGTDIVVAVDAPGRTSPAGAGDPVALVCPPDACAIVGQPRDAALVEGAR